MKKLIIVILIFILLIGGGLGVMTALGQGPVAKMLAEQKVKKEEEARKAAEIAASTPPPTVFFDLGTYIIPLVKHHDISRQVGLDMEIEVLATVQNKVNNTIPQLQNAVNVDLYDFLPRHADTKSAADRKAIREHLIALGNRMYGDGAVRDIVIKSMYDR